MCSYILWDVVRLPYISGEAMYVYSSLSIVLIILIDFHVPYNHFMMLDI